MNAVYGTGREEDLDQSSDHPSHLQNSDLCLLLALGSGNRFPCSSFLLLYRASFDKRRIERVFHMHISARNSVALEWHLDGCIMLLIVEVPSDRVV